MTAEKAAETHSSPVDPDRVPKRTLRTGDEMPAIGLGTFGSDHVSGEQIAEAVRGAAEIGYRHFDCAAVYDNEDLIGKSLREITNKGIKREDLWITSKLWNDNHGKGNVIPACKQSLSDLQLDYLDLYLVHWPFPNYHPPGCDVTSRAPDAKPYIHEEYMETWGEMEKLVEMGLARNIGTSNMTIPKLELLFRDANILPACNEMELHPHFQQPQLFNYVRGNGMVAIGFCPIGSPERPERDRTPEDTAPIEDPVIQQIADKHGIHPAVVCVKWAVQRGQVPIPFSTTPAHYLANLRATVTDPLSDEEMDAIASADKNCRFIKGQVFLWKDNQSWEALWDLDGQVTPP
ncbi:MAG: aldo/keto reductase [Candidatus Brocadiia bacterium]